MQSVSASTLFVHGRRLIQNWKTLQSLVPIDPFVDTPDGSRESPSVANAGFDSGLSIILAALLLSVLCTLAVTVVLQCSRGWRVVSEPSLDVGVERTKTGIKKIDVKALPAMVYHEISPFGSLDRPIFLAEFMEGEKEQVLLDFCHSFHADCIDTWLISNPSCPSCRSSLLYVGLKKPSGVTSLATKVAERGRMDVIERNEYDATNHVVQTFNSSADDTPMTTSSSLESIDLETSNMGESKSIIGKIG